MSKRNATIACICCTLAISTVLARADDHGCNIENAPVRFIAYDIFIDVGDAELGAYQLDIHDNAHASKVVGVEAGAHAAFADKPPYYDPKALHNTGHIVLAAYSTAEELPTGKTRVARLHLQVCGDVDADFELDLIVAADADGQETTATATAVPAEGK